MTSESRNRTGRC